MITLQLHQTDGKQRRVNSDYIKNIITHTIYNKGQLQLFSEQITGDKDFICSEKIVDDENINDVSYTIENKSKTLKIFVYDNMISIEGHETRIIFNKLYDIVNRISSYSNSNLWIFTMRFPIGEMKTILSECGIKKDNDYSWSGILHTDDIKTLVQKFEPFFKEK